MNQSLIDEVRLTYLKLPVLEAVKGRVQRDSSGEVERRVVADTGGATDGIQEGRAEVGRALEVGHPSLVTHTGLQAAPVSVGRGQTGVDGQAGVVSVHKTRVDGVHVVTAQVQLAGYLSHHHRV